MPSSKKIRRKQTQLSFTPAPTSSPLRPKVNVRLSHAPTPSKKRRIADDSDSESLNRQLSPDIAEAISLSKRDLRFLLQSPESEADQLPTPDASSQLEPQGTNGKRQLRSRGVNYANPVQSAATKSSPDSQHVTFSSGSDNTESMPVFSREKTKATSTTLSSSSEDSEEELPDPKPTRPPTVRSFLAGGTSGTAAIPKSKRNGRRFSLLKSSAKSRINSSSSEDDTTYDNRVLARTSARHNTSQQNGGHVAKDREDEDEDEDESDVIPVTPSRRRPSRRVKSSSKEDKEDEDDAVLVTPSRRRRIVKPPKKPSEDDDDSMLEELGAAESQESEKRQTRGGRGNSARAKRFQELSKLKERRAGAVQIPEDDKGKFEDENEEEEHFTEQDENSDVEIDHDDVSDEERRSKDSDAYESDFIEDDGDIGIDLAKHGVPLGLTGHANKKQYDYFKDAVEWMVHNKLDPAFERNDEIYKMAHEKLNDEYLGLAGSEFKSSVWTVGFIKALQNRPELRTLELSTESMQDKCQACNRSKHPAKWLITFSGPTYDPKSLEKVSSKDTDDSDSHSDEETDDAEQKEEKYWVGSVCCANAEVTHSLYHWRFQLNATILEWLAMNGYTDPVEIIEREGWSRRKKEKLANEIVDGMVNNGEMKDLYKEFKQNLKAAVDARNDKAQHGNGKRSRA